MTIAESGFLVTGGSSGLGAACVQALTDAGAAVTVLDIQPPANGGPGTFHKTDVTDEVQVQAAVDAAKRQRGGLRGVICCAGVELAERVVGRGGPHKLESFRRVIDVNLVGTFNVVRLAAAAMAENAPGEDGERGAVVLTASIAAEEGQVGQAAYAASKAGVCGMVLPLARELARFGVRAVAIAPGTFHTPLMARLGEPVVQSLAQQTPFPARLGDPAEFAALALHVMQNRMFNGAVVRLDGALRMGGR